MELNLEISGGEPQVWVGRVMNSDDGNLTVYTTVATTEALAQADCDEFKASYGLTDNEHAVVEVVQLNLITG